MTGVTSDPRVVTHFIATAPCPIGVPLHHFDGYPATEK